MKVHYCDQALSTFSFYTQSLEPNFMKLHRNQAQHPVSSLFFRVNQSIKMASLALIGRVVFNISTSTTEKNLTKLDKKQVLSVLYQACLSGQSVYKGGIWYLGAWYWALLTFCFKLFWSIFFKCAQRHFSYIVMQHCLDSSPL